MLTDGKPDKLELNIRDMKLRYYLLTFALLFALFSFNTTPTQAQVGNIDDIIRAGVSDAESITKAYLAPIPSGLGGNINSGWVNSAGTHGTLGFDIQVRGVLAFVPQSDENFDLTDLNLEKTSPADPANTVTPTISGNDKLGPEVVVEDNGEEVARFNLPKGSGYPIVPSPMIQAGVGLVRDTDLIARYVPEVSYDNNDFRMVGFGLKHGLNQWIPGAEVLPVDISILGGFTNINLGSDLNLDPEGLPRDSEAATADYDNQRADISINTFTVKALVGKDLPLISVYGGLGYQTSTMDVDVVGNYPVNVSTPVGDRYDVVSNPFSYDADGKNTVSLLGGAKLKLAFFNLFGEFALAKYPSASAGIGFSFR